MYQASPKQLGQRIKMRREQVGLSTAALARRLGVQRDTLAAWESGNSEPRANKLQMLAGILGTNVSWLLEGDAGCGPNPQPTNDTAALREQLGQARDLAQNLSNMLESIQQRIDLLEKEKRTHN
jgi:transcriptional regulator with XRE-family HTH domain